jgi:C1A family cysteine protease
MNIIHYFLFGLCSLFFYNSKSDVNNDGPTFHNQRFIAYRNLQNRSWSLVANKFAGISSYEFDNSYKGYRGSSHGPGVPVLSAIGDTAPKSMDWRTKGVVGKIKDQAACGSCWAFSAVGALESQVALTLNKSVVLSEQEMVDCVKNILSPDNQTTCCYGCGGGEMYAVYQFLEQKRKGKDDTEKQYPYVAMDETCTPKASRIPIGVNGYVALQKDEDLMKNTLAKIGPLSAGVDANQDWQLYDTGIYDPTPSECSQNPEDQDHGIVIVGYGTERSCRDEYCKDINYWIIRNSWGKSWGEKGYMRLARGTNACGIATAVIYPTVIYNNKTSPFA